MWSLDASEPNSMTTRCTWRWPCEAFGVIYCFGLQRLTLNLVPRPYRTVVFAAWVEFHRSNPKEPTQ